MILALISTVSKKFEDFSYRRKLTDSYKILKKVNAWEEKIKNLSDDEIRNRIQEILTKIAEGENLNSFLPEVFTMTREAAQRTINMRHFDVQIIGGYVLHLGAVAEMKTGEGKTLVATLAAVLNALSGKGVHVISVNDYLTQRDWELMSPIYDFLGLSSGYIVSSTNSDTRKEIYKKDIVYITNSEAVFDYLRDNTQTSLSDMVQRGHNFAIFDEADFALIDEARSPIILASQQKRETKVYQVIDHIVRTLTEDDYEKDEKTRHVMLSHDGSINMENILKKGGIIPEDASLYDIDHAYINHFINQSLHAHHMLRKDIDYIVKDGYVFIIDEFTGRIMEGRRYSDGLHQAVEAKENLKIQNENQTIASISLQNYSRLYNKLSGMTGTAATEAKEFREIYNMDVFVIPTNQPVCRIDHNDDIYNTAAEKDEAILKLVKECYERGQPMLIGTISIEKSEKLSRILKENKIRHNVLNAKHHEREAYIIAQAGRSGAVTIATNMAGRGTDIKLGGNLDMMLDDFAKKEKCKLDSEVYLNKKEELQKQVAEDGQKVLEAGGLFVIGTERHESRRIDNQLRGRSGRQGNAGASKFFISLDDDLMRLFGSNRIQKILASLGLKEGEAINHPMINSSIEKAQKKVENHHYGMRKNLIKFDDVINKQRQIIFQKRSHIMKHNDLQQEFEELCVEVMNDLVNEFEQQRDTDSFILQFKENYNIEIVSEEIQEKNHNELHSHLKGLIENNFELKKTKIGAKDLHKVQKRIWLMAMDASWREHINNIDYLKQGINLRSVGQKDPLMEFQRESFEMFQEMFKNMKKNVVKCFFHIEF